MTARDDLQARIDEQNARIGSAFKEISKLNERDHATLEKIAGIETRVHEIDITVRRIAADLQVVQSLNVKMANVEKDKLKEEKEKLESALREEKEKTAKSAAAWKSRWIGLGFTLLTTSLLGTLGAIGSLLMGK